MRSDPSLQSFIGRTFKQWLEHPDLVFALAGHLPPVSESQKRFGVLERRIKELAALT